MNPNISLKPNLTDDVDELIKTLGKISTVGSVMGMNSTLALILKLDSMQEMRDELPVIAWKKLINVMKINSDYIDLGLSSETAAAVAESLISYTSNGCNRLIFKKQEEVEDNLTWELGLIDFFAQRLSATTAFMRNVLPTDSKIAAISTLAMIPGILWKLKETHGCAIDEYILKSEEFFSKSLRPPLIKQIELGSAAQIRVDLNRLEIMRSCLLALTTTMIPSGDLSVVRDEYTLIGIVLSSTNSWKASTAHINDEGSFAGAKLRTSWFEVAEQYLDLALEALARLVRLSFAIQTTLKGHCTKSQLSKLTVELSCSIVHAMSSVPTLANRIQVH